MPAEKNGPVQSIALAAVGQGVGTMPAGGSNVSYAGTWSNWTSIQVANALGDGDIAIEPYEESIDIEGPLDQNRVAEVIFKKGIRSITFNLYQLNATGFSLDGLNASSGSPSVAEDGTTPTYKAMVVEIRGIGMLHFPKVRVSLTEFSSGIKRLSNYAMKCEVFGTAAIASGWQWLDNS